MNAYLIPGKYTIDQAISETFCISEDRLKAEDRRKKREEVEARQLAMWWREQNTNDTLAEIGKIYGGRDHATVLHAKKTINDLMQTNKVFRQKAEKVFKLLEITLLNNGQTTKNKR